MRSFLGKVELKLDWATNEAATFACKNWHYSRCVPKSKQNKIGVWESGKFIGVVMIGNSSGSTVFEFLGLDQFSGAELTRIALNRHVTPVSKIMSIALSMVRKKNPGLKAIVSFADPLQGHVGAVYQAANWKYFGRSTAQTQWFFRGKWRNDMKLNELFKGRPEAKRRLPMRRIDGKYKYVYFFDKKLEGLMSSRFQTYPKRAGNIDADVPTNHVGKGGSIPTPALQNHVSPFLAK